MVVLRPTRVLTPGGFAPGHGVGIEGSFIAAVLPPEACPPDAVELDGDLVPGFIDLQVNGGGGVLLNDQPTVDGVAAIAEAHRAYGTTGLLPTLISDDLAVVAAAIAAVDAAIEAGVPGVLGLHIEGPFLAAAKKGIHNASKFRVLDADAITLLTSLRRGRTLVTLAPEAAPAGAIRALVAAGAVVAAGHTEATYEDMRAAISEGLSGVTHLYNAMSPLSSRAPGVVGAALEDRSLWCGLIVDGHHVHPAALRVAYAAREGQGLVLVTDAMPTVGTSAKTFTLGGQTITADDGRCVAPDGTLAGSNLTMADAVRNAQRLMGLDAHVALEMASAAPASALGLGDTRGAIRPGLRADMALIDAGGNVASTWIGGARR